MYTSDGLDGIRGLHQDLLALSQSRLPVLETLFVELEARIADFKTLLDKSPRKEQSRQKLCAGKLSLKDDEYTINEAFKQSTIQLADVLNLDELEAGHLLLSCHEDALITGRSAVELGISRFHERRSFLLESLRLVLTQSLLRDEEDAAGNMDQGRFVPIFQEIVGFVIQPDEGVSKPRFASRVITAMADIRSWIQDLAGRLQTVSVVGSSQGPELLNMIDFQRTSLLKQHESLGAILTYLIKGGHAKLEDFQSLLSMAKAANKYDDILVHSIPPLIAAIAQFGSPKGGLPQATVKVLHKTVTGIQEGDQWALRYFQAAMSTIWISEYSAWFTELAEPYHKQQGGGGNEVESLEQAFINAVKDGGFDFLLSLSADVKPAEWYDPIRFNFRQLVQKKAPPLLADACSFSEVFQTLLMEQLEQFIDCFVAHMPGTIRQMVTDDDGERLLTIVDQTRVQEFDYGLEKFVIMISYVYENRPDAAQAFWEDDDSNFFGFTQWISTRMTTPRACAVCEMYLALSGGEENATALHKLFIGESSSVAASRLRRPYSMNWEHILEEAQYFAIKLQEPPSSSTYTAGKPNYDASGPESETLNMLESYLRLMARVARESTAARAWLLSQTTWRVLELLFLLASTARATQLRACAFEVLQALLKDKSAELGHNIWTTLDQWIAGGTVTITGNPSGTTTTNTSALTRTSQKFGGSPMNGRGVFDIVSEGFEEPNNFVRLLQALVYPAIDERDLNDALPFPEHLGSAHRMPGIEPYVDFVLGTVFAVRTLELREVIQIRILQLSCLEFILTCLTTFNEDLIVFEHFSNLRVDSAMRTSSLAAYVRLHPFARVMEWLFNDRLLEALFKTTHQDPVEVERATVDSPLLMGLVCSIEVITKVLELQATYLDIVRPLIKQTATGRGRNVANPTLASFEDAILRKLELAVDLALYCRCGHRELTMVSMALLEKLSTARKLVASPSMEVGAELGRNKIVGILQMNNESDEMSSVMTSEMTPDIREIRNGTDAPGHLIKTSILRFLNYCLAALPNQPTVAHLLLGLTCVQDRLEVPANGAFARDSSLFHALLRVIAEYPDGREDVLEGWLLQIKQAALQVLQRLWTSPISATLILDELRYHEFLFAVFVRQPLVTPMTSFDGLSSVDPDFLFQPAAGCLEAFLRQRTSVMTYAATEIRIVAEGRSPTLKSRVLSTLLGSTKTLDGDEQIPNVSLFDLFDFIDLDFAADLTQPTLRFFADIDFSICINDSVEPAQYDLSRVNQLLALKHNQMRKDGVLSTSAADEADLLAEAGQLQLYVQADNQRRTLLIVRLACLRAWTQLLTVTLLMSDFSQSIVTKSTFILQTLQLILPKLERFSSENPIEAAELAQLARSLLTEIQSDTTTTLGKGRAGDIANDRLFHLFRISLRSIHAPAATIELREISYTICYRYLIGVAEASEPGPKLKRHSVQTIKSSGERLIDVICDDAYAGDGTCRISALLLLDALVSLAQQESSTYLLDSLARVNFLGITIDSLKSIPDELRAAEPPEIPHLLPPILLTLSLLLRISRTRPGATVLLSSQLFASIHASTLFLVDPDLGLGLVLPSPSATLNPAGLTGALVYHTLILAHARLLASVVATKGAQSDPCISETTRFLKECRPQIVSFFKRAAGIIGTGDGRRDGSGDDSNAYDGAGSLGAGRESGKATEAASEVMEEIVECFTVMMGVTGFVELEEGEGVGGGTGVGGKRVGRVTRGMYT